MQLHESMAVQMTQWVGHVAICLRKILKCGKYGKMLSVQTACRGQRSDWFSREY